MSHALNLRELELFQRPISKDGSDSIGIPSILRKEEIPADDIESSQDTLSNVPPTPQEKCPSCGGTGVHPVLSRILSKRSIDPGPPPDGGLDAWTQAIVGHIIVFNTWGYINSYGVFQGYYVSTLNHPPSDISWVGSVQVWLLFFIGTFSGRATDAGYFKIIFIAGSIFMVLGAFMTSLATEYWQLFLAQGICTGLGNGLLFCPSLALLSTYFSKKRAVAIGIAASGSATGGMVYPAIVESLLPRIGFGWTLRVVAFVMLALQGVALAFAKPRLPPRKSGPLVEWKAFKELPYVFFSVGMFLNFWGLYFGFYYVGSFAQSMVGLSRSESINLLIMMNGVGLVGRMVPAYFADRYFGPLNTLIPFAMISGVLIFCWAAVHSVGGLYAFAAIYGLFAAGIQSLFPATLSSLTTDMSKMGVRMGMVFTIVSFATLTGTPLAGALIQYKNGSYLAAQMFAGSVLVGGCLILVAARLSRSGMQLKHRM
jgi:MFS family permease